MRIITAEQNSPEWEAARIGRPTASGAQRIVTGLGAPSDQVEKYARELAADLYAGERTDAWQGNAYTDRGHEIEAQAAAWYAFRHDAEPEPIGFVMDDAGRYGASPDRIVGTDGLLEIKCKPKGHMDALLYWKKHGGTQPFYRPQCHMQMLVTDRAWCDLLYYHPTLPSIVVRIERDPEMDTKLRDGLDRCITLRDEMLAVLHEIGGTAAESRAA